jgi:ribosome-associated heat shock protein Hsp15
VEQDEIVVVKKLPVIYTYKIIRPLENRVSAKIAETCILDLTPEDEKSKLTLARSTGFGVRPKGFGRPTKKERRTIDRITETNLEN